MPPPLCDPHGGSLGVAFPNDTYNAYALWTTEGAARRFVSLSTHGALHRRLACPTHCIRPLVSRSTLLQASYALC